MNKNNKRSSSFFSVNHLTKIATFGLIFFYAVLPSQTAFAAPRRGFEAQMVNTKFVYSMEPGETKTIDFAYKNIGQQIWKNKGAGYISLYTFNAKYRKSIFATKDWMDASHPVLLKESSVKVGGVGHFSLKLKAPEKPGLYKETFNLVSEEVTWIPGGEFTINLEVKTGKEIAVNAAKDIVQTSPIQKTSSSDSLAGIVLIRSAKEISVEAGDLISYKVGVKNTGKDVWTTREIRAHEGDVVAMASVSPTAPPQQVAVNINGTVASGALDFMSFSFAAPLKKGSYIVKYQFAANGTVIPNLAIDIPVEVTSDAGDLLNSPLTVDKSQTEELNVITEPMMRIGVLIVDEETDDQVQISCSVDWKLMDGSGKLLSSEVANHAVTAFYKNALYYFNRGQGVEQSISYLRFVPVSPEGICKIVNFDKRKTRRAGYAENTFRNILELRYNSAKNRTWVINELPIEQYLFGLGETSEASNYEFKKALITAARTYATYQWERATKHASEFFHMNAYADDQVYRGYEYEINNPSIRRAAEDTRGITVNYQGRTAITPYFSRSDGRTRDWSEVWHGTVDWIKSVPCPCDAANGRQLWGHGIGMSATEALCMAGQGKKWDEIVHYFYQGIDLRKRW